MFANDYGEGQCISCGFLGKRPVDEHIAECFGITARERAEGNIGVDEPQFIPWCFMGKYHLAREVNELGGDELAKKKVSTIIQRHRECDRWYPAKEWLSPKEHYEQLKMMQVEQDRKQFEERMEEDRRGWQKWMADQAERDRKQSDRMMLRWTILGITLSVLLAIMQLIGAFWAQALFHN
jgi:hypothetical protein